MVKYFEKLRYFEDQENINVKCNCKYKIKYLKNGKFTLKGKYFYSQKIPFFFGLFLAPIWKYVINTSYKIFKKGYVPAQFPFVVLKKGFFIGEVFVEIMDPETYGNNAKKNSKKIKTFDKFEDKFIIVLENTEKRDKIQSLLYLFADIFKLSPKKKFLILVKLLCNRMYQVYFHCPLCDPAESIIDVFFI